MATNRYRKMLSCYPVYMSRLRIIILLFSIVLMSVPHARAGDSGDASGPGADLTKYLHTHHLPLVSAQFVTAADGTREVIVYGFTATDFGKQDAVTKSRRFLNDNAIAISNRIKVRPELDSPRKASLPEDTGDAGASGAYSDQDANPTPAPSNPDAASMRNQSQRDLQSYAAQQGGPQQSQSGIGGAGGPSGLNFGNSGMGLGALLGMGSAGMGVSAGGLDGLLGLLSGAGGYPSYGSGPSGYGSSPQSGYGPPPGFGPSGYGPPSYGPPGYPGYGYPSGGYPPGGGP
jgi:hypothetical protein